VGELEALIPPSSRKAYDSATLCVEAAIHFRR
jgi:hypothetical protein